MGEERMPEFTLCPEGLIKFRFGIKVLKIEHPTQTLYDKVWPQVCPRCGHKLEVSYGGAIDVHYSVDKSGELIKIPEEDRDIFWETAYLNCAGDTCEFEMEVDGIGTDWRERVFEYVPDSL